MNYYDEIKNELINNEVTKKTKNYSINKSDLDTYYNVGRMLSEAGKHYGEGIINDYSKRLTMDLGSGYTPTRLRYFRRFYNVFSIRPTVSDKLSYSHYCEIIWLDDAAINYYINITINERLSVRELRERVKNKEFERLPIETKDKLVKNEDMAIGDFIKNPIVINNNKNIEVIYEKTLQKLILENIESFMNELGPGFTFVGSEYKIKLGNRYNYIDLLLYNLIYRCYVVVELKIDELKKEHIGQLEVYMNYIDDNLKTNLDNKTIGMIICKHNDEYIIKYYSDKRIISREYILI